MRNVSSDVFYRIMSQTVQDTPISVTWVEISHHFLEYSLDSNHTDG